MMYRLNHWRYDNRSLVLQVMEKVAVGQVLAGSSTPHWDRINNICITFKNNSTTAIPGNHVSCTMQ